MLSQYNLKLMRIWVPRITFVLVLILFLLFISGVGYLLTYFLESSPYFRVNVTNFSDKEDLDQEKKSSINNILKERATEREKIRNSSGESNEGKKDPFNLP